MLPDRPNNNIIWLSQPGPGGGGGGGGNQMKEPPRKAELPGKDKITVPVEKPPKLEPPKQAKNEPDPVEQLNIPAKSLAAAQRLAARRDRSAARTADARRRDRAAAAAPAPAPAPASVPGTGSGLGPGSGGGTGGGVYQPGNGVTLPRVLHEVKPQYTSDAMRAKVQGTVLLECVVRPDGSVGDVQVVRSLDSTFGLDQEAIKAAQAVALRARHAPGRGRSRPDHDRADVHAPLRQVGQDGRQAGRQRKGPASVTLAGPFVEFEFDN